MLINGVPICLKKGDITKETADVIVNSTNKSLDLNTGKCFFAAASKLNSIVLLPFMLKQV